MGRVVLGSFLAAVLVFIWGFVFWATSLSEGTHAMAPDDRAVADRLDEVLPRSGTYVIPQATGDREEWERRHEEGPSAMIHYRKTGVDVVSARVFFGGFVQQWATFFLIGLLLWMVGGRLADWSERTGFVAVIGLALAIWTHLGNIIWFHHPADYTLMVAVFDLLAWTMAGVALAAIVRPEESSDDENPG